MGCDMCGAESELYKVDVEGTIMDLCRKCSGYGKVIEEPKQPEIKREFNPVQRIQKPQIIQVIVSDYARLIRDKRTRLGLKQEDFAKKINERTSLIHNIEIGHIEPSTKLARKIERFLNIKLIEEIEDVKQSAQKVTSEKLTLGDLIKIKQKKD